MKKKEMFQRVTRVGLAGIMCAGMLLTGCGKESETDVETGDVSEQVELKILMAGDEPADQQTVLDKISEVTKDELNITLDVEYIPWTDYQEKVKMMAAGGDEFDIFLNFGFDANEALRRKMAIPLDELLEKYGQDILNNVPEMEFAPFVVNGETAAIPAVYVKDNVAATFLIRKDLREKYNVPEVTDYESLKVYLDAISKNEPSMIPVGSDGYNYSSGLARATATQNDFVGTTSVVKWAVDEEGNAVAFNRYEKGFQDYELIQFSKEFYDNGWVEKDVLSQKDARGLFTSGKSALYNIDLFNFGAVETELKANIPDAELEWGILNPEDPISWEKSNNVAQISSTSKNPERAMMFMNWLQKDQANYDLYMYGIEGVHYTLEGDLVKLPEGVDASNNPYAPTPWAFYNTKYHRATTTDSPLTVEAMKYFQEAERYPINEDLVGFTFDTTPVSVEVGQCSKIVQEEWYPMLAGVRGTEADYETFMQDLEAAGAQAIVEEAQKQLDEYMANK